MNNLPERVASKIAIDPKTGCWMWQAAKDPHGYGRVRWGKGSAFAHRVVFQVLRGDIPKGLSLDHLCRVPSCVNPDHLEPVTHETNVKRGVSSAALKRKWAEHLWCPKGHPLFGDNLYTHTTRRGHVNKQCRTCRSDTARVRYAASRSKREAA